MSRVPYIEQGINDAKWYLAETSSKMRRTSPTRALMHLTCAIAHLRMAEADLDAYDRETEDDKEAT